MGRCREGRVSAGSARFVEFSVCVSAPGPCSAWICNAFAIRTKCDCKAGSGTSHANCMQSDAKRRHSNSCFRNFSDSDIARLLNRHCNDCTAPRVLSVVYATERGRKNMARAPAQAPAFGIKRQARTVRRDVHDLVHGVWDAKGKGSPQRPGCMHGALGRDRRASLF